MVMIVECRELTIAWAEEDEFVEFVVSALEAVSEMNFISTGSIGILVCAEDESFDLAESLNFVSMGSIGLSIMTEVKLLVVLED